MEVSDVSPHLQERLGVEATVGLLELFETARQEWTADVTTAAVERFERRLTEESGALRVQIADLRMEMRDGDSALRLEMRELAATLRGEMQELAAGLRGEITSLRQDNLAGRFDLLKWCFVFWVGQVFAMAGVVALVVRLMGAP